MGLLDDRRWESNIHVHGWTKGGGRDYDLIKP